MSFRRMAGLAGIASVILFVGSFVAYGSLPSTDATAAEVAQYISDAGGYALANVLGAFAALFMLVFLVGFAIPFRASDREHGEGFGTMIVSAGAVATAVIGMGSVLFAVLSNRLEALDGPAVWVLWDSGNMSFGFAQLTFFFGGGAAAVAIMRRGVMPRWFGILSGVVALASLGGLAGYFTAGSGAVVGALVGFGGILVWLLVGGILMLRSKA